VNFVAGAVQKPGVDEYHTRLCGVNAGFQVYRRTTLLVHDAYLERIRRQPQALLDTFEKFHRGGHFLGPVQFRFHHIDTAGAAVAVFSQAEQIVLGCQRYDHRIQETFRYRLAIQRNRVGVHVNADVTHQHQTAAWRYVPLAVG
jgi:hypothetical protein